MKVFNMKYLAVAICVALCIPASPVRAAWSEQLMQRATDFLQTYAAPYVPYLKKPETYAVVAAAALGTYFVGREIYWGVKSELPINRVASYLNAGIATTVQDHQKRNQLQDLIMARQEIAQVGPNLIKKQVLDYLSKQYTLDYELNRLPEVPRACDWNERGVEVIDHSSFVALQTGANCGYHAAFNATRLLQLLRAQSSVVRNVLFDALKGGPPIANWKSVIEVRYQTNQSDQSYENITDEAVQFLMADELHVSPNDFTVIANPSQDPALFDEHVPQVIAALQNGSKKVHAFLLGNMRDDFSVGGSGGHWITAVVTTEGGLKVHVADSIAGRSEGRRETIGHLVQLLQQNTEWASMKGDIESRIETAKNILEQNKDFNGCRMRLQELVDDMRKQSSSLQNEFRAHFGLLMNSLLDRLSAAKDIMVTSIVDDNKKQSGIEIQPEAIFRSLDNALTEMYIFISGANASSVAGPSSSSVINSLLYNRPSTLVSCKAS